MKRGGEAAIKLVENVRVRHAAGLPSRPRTRAFAVFGPNITVRLFALAIACVLAAAIGCGPKIRRLAPEGSGFSVSVSDDPVCGNVPPYDSPWARLTGRRCYFKKDAGPFGLGSNAYSIGWRELPQGIGREQYGALLSACQQEIVRETLEGLKRFGDPAEGVALKAEFGVARPVAIDGAQGVEFAGTIGDASDRRPTVASFQLVISNGHLYELDAWGLQFDEARDGEWQRILETFRFTGLRDGQSEGGK